MKTSKKLLWGGFAALLLMSLMFQLYVKKEYNVYQSTKIVGSNQVTEKEISISTFNELEIEDHLEVHIRKGDPKVVTKIDDNLHDLIEVKTEADRLTLRSVKNTPYDSKHRFTVIVYTNNFSQLRAKDFCHIVFQDSMQFTHFTMAGSDHSSFKGNVQCEELNLSLSDFADFDLRGKTNKAQVAMSEHASIEADHMYVDELNIAMVDFANAKFTVINRLEAKASDHASLEYLGNPADKNVSTDDFAEIEGDN